jgi:hypothetical protein
MVIDGFVQEGRDKDVLRRTKVPVCHYEQSPQQSKQISFIPLWDTRHRQL